MSAKLDDLCEQLDRLLELREYLENRYAKSYQELQRDAQDIGVLSLRIQEIKTQVDEQRERELK